MKRNLAIILAWVCLLLLSTAYQAGDEPEAGATRVAEVDGMTMVFVPAGKFSMGSDEADPEAERDEKPQHTPHLDAYWIDQTEVTNAMYARCVETGACTAPMHSAPYKLPEYAQHPVFGVTWFQAQEYCLWAGRRLPTEAEWEKAARGTDGRRYPWGNAAPDLNLLNFGKLIGDTSEVGSYPAGASPYGALDMAGNVWEWVSDGYRADYYAHSPEVNPPGGASANQRVVRGGAWGVDARAVRVANRFWAFPGRNDTDGFRCALSAPAGPASTSQTSSVTATVTSAWSDLLEKEPFAYATPLPDPVPSPVDGMYAKVDQSWPQWWECRRCADYRPSGGIWKLQFDQGVMRLYYEVTGWRSLGSFTVSGDHLTIFNDPYCPEDAGEYRWKLENGQLKLEVVADSCAFGLRGKNLSHQAWPACLPPAQTAEADDPLPQPPGCEENLVPAALSPADLPVTVAVHGGDSRFFEKPPDVIAFANGVARAEREGINIAYHRESIPFGLNRVLWWQGDWIEAKTDQPFTAMGVQFSSNSPAGWARVLFDGVEVWRGNTYTIWSKYDLHAGYIEISGFSPGTHTIRAESLGFDYYPVPVASFGFNREGKVESNLK
jgi:formylglycine-generating enzyme required for sulfatase activity